MPTQPQSPTRHVSFAEPASLSALTNRSRLLSISEPQPRPAPILREGTRPTIYRTRPSSTQLKAPPSTLTQSVQGLPSPTPSSSDIALAYRTRYANYLASTFNISVQAAQVETDYQLSSRRASECSEAETEPRGEHEQRPS
ncbi:hypothetical protein BU16DRAFT_557347 [Lophium mytilinum]|uniref:Uncharacterized protein n=1 Tax=Lophium mytilinum TaxID=390894 RepID=A0A6A6R2R0_9PEZI|nr:hypothetical protein BU16DRAFT_557347 [Lophium mytilinum]